MADSVTSSRDRKDAGQTSRRDAAVVTVDDGAQGDDASPADRDDPRGEDDSADTSSDDEIADDDALAGEDDVMSGDAAVRDAGGRGDSGAGRDAAIGSDAAARVDAAAGGSSAGGCDALTFETYGKEALGTFCARCHSGDEPLGRFPFDTLPEVKLHKAALRKEVVEQRTMPPGAAQPAMTDADRKKFGEWLACGPN